MSRDFTAGYGPEEYVLRQAKPGEYSIYVKLFGQRKAHVSGSTVQVRIYTYFGSPDKEKVETYTVRLDKDKELIHVASVTFS